MTRISFSNRRRRTGFVSCGVFLCLALLGSAISAQTLPEDAPVLISEPGSTRALTARPARRGIDDSARVFAPGGQTRVTVFVTNLELLKGEGANAFRADVQDAQFYRYPLEIISLEPTAERPWVYALTVRLHAQLGDVGDHLEGGGRRQRGERTQGVALDPRGDHDEQVALVLGRWVAGEQAGAAEHLDGPADARVRVLGQDGLAVAELGLVLDAGGPGDLHDHVGPVGSDAAEDEALATGQRRRVGHAVPAAGARGPRAPLLVRPASRHRRGPSLRIPPRGHRL